MINSSYQAEIVSYEIEENNYVVTQKVKYSHEHETENFNVIWKFDMNIKFVSTYREAE